MNSAALIQSVELLVRVYRAGATAVRCRNFYSVLQPREPLLSRRRRCHVRVEIG